jgi:hypothetical protein
MADRVATEIDDDRADDDGAAVIMPMPRADLASNAAPARLAMLGTDGNNDDNDDDAAVDDAADDADVAFPPPPRLPPVPADRRMASASQSTSLIRVTEMQTGDDTDANDVGDDNDFEDDGGLRRTRKLDTSMRLAIFAATNCSNVCGRWLTSNASTRIAEAEAEAAIGARARAGGDSGVGTEGNDEDNDDKDDDEAEIAERATKEGVVAVSPACALSPDDALLVMNDDTVADEDDDDDDVEDASACHRERRANECNDDSGESSPKLAV